MRKRRFNMHHLNAPNSAPNLAQDFVLDCDIDFGAIELRYLDVLFPKKDLDIITAALKEEFLKLRSAQYNSIEVETIISKRKL